MNAQAEARRILADPEIVLSSGEWRKIVAGLVELIDDERLDYDGDQSDQPAGRK